jgi:hypothetical protein
VNSINPFSRPKINPIRVDNTPRWGHTCFMKIKTIPQVVVEMPEFIRQAKMCMDDELRESFISHIAANPLQGELIVGTGGVRKVRWAADAHQGKRGGVRVLYYYHNQAIPIFLFTVYGKSKKANLTQAERNILKTITSKIVRSYEEIGDE